MTPLERAIEILRYRADKERHYATVSGIDHDTKRACEVSAATFEEAAIIVKGVQADANGSK